MFSVSIKLFDGLTIGMQYDLTGSRKSKMAVFKPEVSISQFVNKGRNGISTVLMFSISSYPTELVGMQSENVVRPNRKWKIQV